MPSVVETFDADHVWGWIEDDSGVKTFYDQTSTIGQQKCRNGAYIVDRAYYSFVTSGLPRGAGVVGATWKSRIKEVTENVLCNVSNYSLRLFWEHDRIGLSIGVGDWGFANQDNDIKWGATPPGDDTDFEIELNFPRDAINKDGDTDLEIRGNSQYVDCDNGPAFQLYNKWFGPVYYTKLEVEYLLQGVLGKTPSGNISYYGGMCLATLSKLLMQAGIIPPMSEIDRVEGSDIYVATKFAPRMVMGACS